jgi:hypothetical protein
LDKPTAISSNTTVRKALGRLKLFNSGFMFSFRCATEEIGLITEKVIKVPEGVTERQLTGLIKVLKGLKY